MAHEWMQPAQISYARVECPLVALDWTFIDPVGNYYRLKLGTLVSVEVTIGNTKVMAYLL